MSKILKNNTMSDILINDVGITLQASSSYTIQASESNIWADSEDVINELSSGDITLNDGLLDLSLSDAINHLRGYTSKLVTLSSTTPQGINEVAITKPDGDTKTFISHNFCDNTTWPLTSDSKWQLKPPTGKIYKVYKAEVQFSHDVQMGSGIPPKKMKLDVIVAGSALPGESKVFSSITDVFDLGNKHYSMNETVDGVPGMTTVVFDYTNTIILKSSYGMSMDFYIENNDELGGVHCSVSLVAELLDE